ncbi:MAG TPA: FG-GAP-like repeat-containing protein [Candidatus Kapabacteria bacterium]|nr:FG-GAP-like repeat-containing protein [Candidatus Kapabacteria bacterium]
MKAYFPVLLTVLSVLPLPRAVFAQYLFEDASSKAGISATSSQSTQVGPGPIIFDFDNDGWEDIYTAGGTGIDHLWKNMGNGTFVDVSDSLFKNRFNSFSYTRGGSALDYDNDGLTDLYICCEKHDLLLKNMGGGVFADYTKQAHIERPISLNESNCSTFGDFDGDGDNDIYVARWVEEYKFVSDSAGKAHYAHKGFPNQFYINNGDGTFTESAFQYHIDGDTGCSNIALFFDIDGDGDLDLLIGNDFGIDIQPNIVFKNMLMETGTASFVDVTDSMGMRSHLFCMGIGPNDFDRDGNFDFFETNIGHEVLYKNQNGHYADVSTEAGVPSGAVRHNLDYAAVSWTPIFNDFDNDGWEDAFIVHGYVGVFNALDPDTSQYIRNLGGYFEDYTDTAMNGNILNQRGRGGALFDYDHDGYCDMVYGSENVISGFLSKDFKLLHNITPTINHNPAHMLEMKFTAKRTAKEGIGTIVNVWAGGINHARQVSTGGGFTSMSSLIQHVGLGTYNKADSIIVYWPANKDRHRQIDRYYNVKADQMVFFEEKMDSSSIGMVKTEALNVPATVVSTAPMTESLQMYPQPATTRLNVTGLPSGSSFQYEIYNMLGEKVITGTSNGTPLFVNVANLQSGCYTFKISSDHESIAKQFIKE